MNVLDHGFVDLIETWGSDENVICAARQSTDGAFRRWEDSWICPKCKTSFNDEFDFCGCCRIRVDWIHTKGDARLLRYLYRNKHLTPFEMAGAIFEVKAPIFVFREWHRHRTQSYNEMSARYIPIPDENYVPSVERLMKKDSHNKQAGALAEADLTTKAAQEFQNMLRTMYIDVQDTYEYGLEMGVPKELARILLPVGRYSKMWASANLRNWLQFLELRNDSAAQWEIQEYARAVQALLKDHFPRTLALFEEGRSPSGGPK